MKHKLLEDLAQYAAPDIAGMAQPGARPAVDARDVAIFNDALAAPGRGSSVPATATAPVEQGHSVLAMLSAFASGHQGQVQRVEKNMLRVAKTADPLRMYKLNEQYSQLMLQHALAMKVVSKTGQALDQLTKLQ